MTKYPIVCSPSPLDQFYAREIRAGALPPQAAMSITDTMLRADVLTDTDGWDTVLGPPVDTAPDGSTLHRVEWATTALLRVVCPSTGRQYVLGVPPTVRRAEEARQWVNLDTKPEVES